MYSPEQGVRSRIVSGGRTIVVPTNKETLKGHLRKDVHRRREDSASRTPSLTQIDMRVLKDLVRYCVVPTT